MSGNAGAESLEGVRIFAPMSQFPTVRRGNRLVHAGRISVVRRFDPPLEIDKGRFLDIHLRTSREIPASIHIDRGFRTSSDVELIAGEQVVRIDFGSFVDHRFNVPKWEDRIHKMSIDFWPQDNLYPYNQSVDTEIVFLGLEVKNYNTFNRNDNSIAMTHFRPNFSPRREILRDISEPYTRLMISNDNLEPLAKNFMLTKITEQYRTVTVHRIVSPISRIITEANDTEAIDAALQLKSFIAKAFGKNMPHLVVGKDEHQAIANSFFLRKKDNIDGYYVHAKHGAVRVEGKTRELILKGVSQYFEQNALPGRGILGNSPGPHKSDSLLHEFILFEGKRQP